MYVYARIADNGSCNDAYVTLILTIEEHVCGESITQVSVDRPLLTLPLPPDEKKDMHECHCHPIGAHGAAYDPHH